MKAQVNRQVIKPKKLHLLCGVMEEHVPAQHTTFPLRLLLLKLTLSRKRGRHCSATMDPMLNEVADFYEGNTPLEQFLKSNLQYY